jgi:hypothetical protein
MNTNFVIYNSDGVILRVGNCPSEAAPFQVGPGEFMLETHADPLADSVDVVAGVVVPGGRVLPEPAAVPPDTYSDVRRRMYPSVTEQLDMLWHAMDTNTVERAEPFYSTIKAVKDAVPKTADDVIFDVGAG